MAESKNEPRFSRFCITKTWLIIWVISSSIVILACYLFRPYVFFEDEFSVLVNAMNVIAYVLTIGLPVFLVPSIVFGTSSAKEHITALLKSGKSTISVFLRCLIESFFLVLVFSVSITSALFLESFLAGTSFHRPEGTGFLIYLPPVLIATLVVSLLLASVGLLFVMVTDDIIISTAMGCAVTLGLATLVGWNSYTLCNSLTRGIAMFSPSNIARIFAGSISSYTSADDFTITSYFGFTASLSSIVLSLVVFVFIVFIGLIVSIRIFQFNASYWMKGGGIKKSMEIWESEPECQEEYAKIKERLKIRRLVLVGLVIFMLTIMTVETTSYTSTVIEENTIIFYQSPEGGEQINLGDWHFFPCDVQPARYGLWNILHYSCIIDDWGNCPEELRFYDRMLNMSSSEFQVLNETSRRLVCGSPRNITREEWWGIGAASWNIGFYYGPFTFALLVIAAGNETVSGFMYCSITLAQSPTIHFR